MWDFSHFPKNEPVYARKKSGATLTSFRSQNEPANSADEAKDLIVGVELADSWATDAHKWLNVPYDSGLVIIRRSENHHILKQEQCDYAGASQPGH